MRIDSQTLSELDIINNQGIGLSIIDYVDKTITTGGKYHLRNYFLNPPDNLAMLIDQQQAIKYLAYHLNDFKLPFNNNKIKSLENYLSSNIDILENINVLEVTRFCLIDKPAYQYIKESIIEVIDFVKGFDQLLINISTENIPILNKFYTFIKSVIKDESYTKACILYNKPTLFNQNIFKADKLIREKLAMKFYSLIQYYYDFDALYSMANCTVENNLTFPDFCSGEILFEVENLYHPLLEKSKPYNVAVYNESNFIFLTGPNMSGKTTFLKTVGISLVLSHVGMGIPANKAKLSYFDRLITSLNITDNILVGNSFFYSEVQRVKQLAKYLNKGEHVFSLFDELFRGTNVKDAFDASILIISGLVQWEKSMFVISSHLWEIADHIDHYKNVRYLSFETIEKSGKYFFTYKLIPGISNIRLAMYIINNEHIMELLNSSENKYFPDYL